MSDSTRQNAGPGTLVGLRVALTVSMLLGFATALPGFRTVLARAAEDLSEPPLTDTDLEHWAFQPLRTSPLPLPENLESCESPVDVWLGVRQARAGLDRAPPASPAVWLRRISFDLAGLPPPPERLAEFAADRRPDASERLADRLLASPSYGERVAQHWLDLARYAETDGYEHDKLRPQAWKYRDWVIAALNADLPYDRFLQLQLAGDELQEGPDAGLPTAFCLSGPDMPDINLQQERRHMLLNELTATIGSALLGLQLGCAQCHDHKYDPISQADFYRLRAFFESSVHLQKDQPVTLLSEQPGVSPTSYFYRRGDWRQAGAEVSSNVPRVVAASLPLTAASPARRRSALAQWITSPAHPLTWRVEANRIWQQHFGEALCRTAEDFGVMGDTPKQPELLDWLAAELLRHGASEKRLRRLLVLSAAYRQASRGEEGGESDPSADPENRLYARYPRRRLDGEAIRDSMLSAAGMLNRRMGGPGVMPPLPPELEETLLKNQWDVTADEAEHDRRSIYVFARRNLRYPLFENFDRPDPNTSCATRHRSTTALQSLLLLNSEFALQTARRMAGSVLAETGGDMEDSIRRVYLRTLSRAPRGEELGAAQEFLANQAELLRGEGRKERELALPLPPRDGPDPFAAAAFTDLCLAMFNLSEFIYLD